MTTRRQTAAPLSPALLAGIAARPLPLAPLQPVLALALRAMHRRHPAVFRRLAELGDARFAIDPVDLPFAFELAADPPRLRAVRRANPAAATAVVRGPMALLTALLEGRIDGDALFFGRGLTIEGDTEAVLALRNAVDGAEIDIAADLTAELGPLRGPARHLAALLRRAHVAAEADLERLRAAMLAPAARRHDALAARVDALEKAVRSAPSRPRRAPAGPVT